MIDPLERIFSITPNNVTVLDHDTRGLMITTEHDIRLQTVGGDIITIPSGGLAAGYFHPIRVRYVFATGTNLTSGQIFGGY